MAEFDANANILRLRDDNEKVITFDHDDVTALIFKALKASGSSDRLLALNMADKVIYRLKSWKGNTILTMHEIIYMIKFVLVEAGQQEASNQIHTDRTQVPQFNWG
jgi:hypothetical protein